MEIEPKVERNSIISEQPHIGIFGEQHVCYDAVIEDICCKASEEDLNTVTLFQAELRHRFLSVIVKTVVNAPPAKKRRRK